MEDVHRGGIYEIVVGIGVDDGWTHWFSDFELRAAGDSTLLTGALADQSALHGVLARLRDLGLPIIAVRRMSDAPDRGSHRGNTPPGT